MRTIETKDLIFKPRDLRERSEQVLSSNHRVHRIAHPLFETGVSLVALTERQGSNSSGLNAVDFHLVMIVLQGTMAVQLGDEHCTLMPGDMAYSPPGTSFSRSAPGACWWLYFHLNDSDHWSPWKRKGPYVKPLSAAPLFYLHLRRVLDGVVDKSLCATERALDGSRMLSALLYEEMVCATETVSPHHDDLHQLVDEVSHAPQLDWTLKTMASRVNLSKRHFSRLFHSEFGIPPLEMVIQHRMKHAAHLLSFTDTTIAAIASEVGYESVYSFSRLFKSHMGIPPGEYRNTPIL